MGRKIDITNQRFGRLIALKPIGTTKRGEVIWDCICDCGNHVSVICASLRSGNTKSCGCFKTDSTSKRGTNNLIGQRFGRLTVIKRVGSNQHGKAIWLCRCDCGKEKEVVSTHLTRSKDPIKSCGCYRKENTKKRFNKGGTTNIGNYLRTIVLDKTFTSTILKEVGCKCELTGKHGMLHIHHIVGFNTIVIQAHEHNNIEIKQAIQDYTDKELELLLEYVKKWHMTHREDLIVLEEEVHKMFHKLYGRGNNNREQFEEFKNKLINKEIAL